MLNYVHSCYSAMFWVRVARVSPVCSYDTECQKSVAETGRCSRNGHYLTLRLLSGGQTVEMWPERIVVVTLPLYTVRERHFYPPEPRWNLHDKLRPFLPFCYVLGESCACEPS